MASSAGYVQAMEDFRRTRRQAALQQALGRLTGRPDHLLSYEDVRRKVGAQGEISKGLQEIPLDNIVGSVGRYTDFTSTFLPRSDSMGERWARVKTVATDMGGWPPIEVYQLGDAYFVIDGNHRVSVAREMEIETIPAYVTEVKTKVPVDADTETDELICRARHAHFLETTGLDRLRPEADVNLTAPGGYRALLEHIEVHRHYMGIQEEREIPYEEAVTHWYDTVYWPVIFIIREQGLLHDFPQRTETDLYLWLADHRAELEEALGWRVQADVAAEDLAQQASSRPERVLARVGSKILGAVWPDELEPGPAPGQWRSARGDGASDRLFRDILVAIDGKERGWRALEQAIFIAQREESEVRGLHVASFSEDEGGEQWAPMRERFRQQLEEAGVSGQFVVESGPVVHRICDRARWNDLVTMPLTYPPGDQALQRLGSSFRQIVHRCSRPVLAVSELATPMDRPLLAYDGSAKAREALFVAAYVAGRWQSTLTVIAAAREMEEGEELLSEARAYLEEHGVEAVYLTKQPPAAAAILAAADMHDCDFLLLGGYGARPLFEAVKGSVLDDLLRTSHKPLLICR